MASRNITGSIMYSRKRWMVYALALSLVLHLGAAIIFICAAEFGIGGTKTHEFYLQEIDFIPSMREAPKKTAALPVLAPDMSSTPHSAPQESIKSAQEPVPERPLESTGSSENVRSISSTPLGLGMTHGYFSSLADGRSLRDDIRVYYFEMVEKINREWWGKAGQLKEPLRQDGVFDLMIQRDGTIISIRMLKGTGSNEADRLLAEIIRSASPLPVLPSTYEMDVFRAPLRIKAPSILFRLNN